MCGLGKYLVGTAFLVLLVDFLRNICMHADMYSLYAWNLACEGYRRSRTHCLCESVIFIVRRLTIMKMKFHWTSCEVITATENIQQAIVPMIHGGQRVV